MADPLDGKWYSSVKSSLDLKVEGSTLSGSFNSTEDHSPLSFPLVGVVDPDPSLPNRALSLAVSWIDKDTTKYRSVTSYTGQYHYNGAKEKEAINTTFLMVDETTEANQYKSTYVGYDNFSRKKP